MKTPWDYEPTPLTDANAKELINYGTRWKHDPYGSEVDADVCRELERRMRHAERLLASHDAAMDYGPDGISNWMSSVQEHLTAAAKEDQ